MFRHSSDAYTKLGVPVLRACDIENFAIEFLNKFAPECLSKPPTPIFEILNKLNGQYKVGIVLHSDLGHKGTKKVLGQIKVNRELSKNTIYIDREFLENTEANRYKFAIAHEIGHLVFHSKEKLNLPDDENNSKGQMIDTDSNFWSYGPKVPRDWVEYHANNFAAAILIPVPAIEEECWLSLERMETPPIFNEEITLEKWFNQYSPLSMEDLHKKFAVSKEAMKYRLKNLKLSYNKEGFSFFRQRQKRGEGKSLFVFRLFTLLHALFCPSFCLFNYFFPFSGFK